MAKNKKSKVAKLRVYRDAATGRFVKKYAEKHPKTTVKEPRP
jgi:hypothetical protein